MRQIDIGTPKTSFKLYIQGHSDTVSFGLVMKETVRTGYTRHMLNDSTYWQYNCDDSSRMVTNLRVLHRSSYQRLTSLII